MQKCISRRSFIIESSKLAAGLCFAGIPASLSCTRRQVTVNPTKVGLVQSAGVIDGSSFKQDILVQMLDQGIQSITGYDSPDKAWNSLFFKNDIVALKVNCIGRQTGSTKPDVCYATAECLNRYVGIPLENIIVFDRTDAELEAAGYKINKSGKGVQIYESPGYSSPFKVDHIPMGVSTIITEKCTALINVPLLKTHRSAGFTLNLKNHYGSIPTDTVKDSQYKFHSDGKYENVVRVNTLPPIADKSRICIADGLIAQYNDGPRGNPQYQWAFNGVIMGKDPVAVDAVGLKVINEQRVLNNLEQTKVKYLQWAGEEGLGANNLDYIDLIQKQL